jgi:hypothetical protein
VDDCVVLVVSTEYGNQTLVDAIDELVADADGEMLVTCKRLHGVHHALIIRKGWCADNISVGILIGLLDVLECRLGLIEILRSDLVENGSIDLMPSNPQYLLFILDGE